MAFVEDNSSQYRPGALGRSKSRLANEVFLVKVVTVDYERKVLTVMDIRDRIVYTEIGIFPAVYSSIEGGDAVLPARPLGLACNVAYEAGFRQIAILAWTTMSSLRTVDSTASGGGRRRDTGLERPAAAGRIARRTPDRKPPPTRMGSPRR